MSKKYLIPCLLTLSISILLSSCSLNRPFDNDPINLPENSVPTPKSASSSSPSPKVTPGNSVVAIKTKYGQIVLSLFDQQAPNTVKNFLQKSRSGFYHNLKFHRVVDGFVVQGGDPQGTGQGGGTIASELNQIPFKRGSLGLARLPDSKEVSNDSQFFICLTDVGCSQLKGDYVNFGEVISGLEVLDQIKQGDLILEITQDTK